MNKKMFIKVLLFNLLEIISVFIIGMGLKVKSDYIIAVVLLFPISRFIFKKPMHYKRSRDNKYRGYGHLDRMYNEYGNYSYGRERYGANEDTKRSLEYMLRSMEDFARMLKEEAQSQEEVQMIRETAKRIAQM